MYLSSPMRLLTRNSQQRNGCTSPRNDTLMTTMLMQELKAGDVIEVKTAATAVDDTMTVLVLLATDEFLILDPCNELTPFVLKTNELVEYRKFDPAVAYV